MLKIILALLIAIPSIALAEDTNTKSDIRRVIRKNLRDIKNCYKSSLEKVSNEEKFEGKIVAGWDFDKDGTVTKSWIVDEKTTMKNEEVKTCVTAAIKNWKFPANAEGKATTIHGYPFLMKLDEKKN
ncbi:AgmX/PglI C-terminal domain-containing protein [Bdellovibrio sp. HCB209]|uniref:AgmX/PglI C-terminal domain-containing protein n=1 Tax=Bdellovibrio sp. HCB209 TaxID=3394354 RepID=UPI0039B67E99